MTQGGRFQFLSLSGRKQGGSEKHFSEGKQSCGSAVVETCLSQPAVATSGPQDIVTFGLFIPSGF